MKKLYIIVVPTVIILIVTFVILVANTSFSAMFADNVLRPIAGEKRTLALESLLFGFQDRINGWRYRVAGSQAPKFTTTQNNVVVPATSDQMDLNPIKLLQTGMPLTQEGLWKPISQSLYPHQIIAASTFIRPDQTRPYAVVSLVKMDMKKLGVGVVAGTYYPGGAHKLYGTGMIPKSIQNDNTLFAAFNGGFQEKDGHYGMITGNTTYVPLKKDLATVVLYKDGTVQLTNYTGQSFSPNVIGIRQNGPFLIRDGEITSFVEQGPDTWGRTTTNTMYTWRSGLGITKEGNLIYAVGNSLVPDTLARALLAAGAQNALQLDINPYWVRYILYQNTANGTYTHYPLITSMHDGGNQYLHGYNKDFFFVYKKN